MNFKEIKESFRMKKTRKNPQKNLHLFEQLNCYVNQKLK